MYGLRFEGCRYDIGNKLDFIKTNMTFALMRDDLRDDVAQFIRGLVDELDAGAGRGGQSAAPANAENE